MSNERAVSEARKIAYMYRRAGFPDAQAAPEYCVDEVGTDGFYTYIVSVYVGDKDPKAGSHLWRKLADKLGLEK